MIGICHAQFWFVHHVISFTHLFQLLTFLLLLLVHEGQVLDGHNKGFVKLSGIEIVGRSGAPARVGRSPRQPLHKLFRVVGLLLQLGPQRGNLSNFFSSPKYVFKSVFYSHDLVIIFLSASKLTFNLFI